LLKQVLQIQRKKSKTMRKRNGANKMSPTPRQLKEMMRTSSGTLDRENSMIMSLASSSNIEWLQIDNVVT
jgi:hypothetical protein